MDNGVNMVGWELKVECERSSGDESLLFCLHIKL